MFVIDEKTKNKQNKKTREGLRFNNLAPGKGFRELAAV